jgi:threonine 3-dehydrogenase
VVVSEPCGFGGVVGLGWGATVAVDPTKQTLKKVQQDLGMVEGFDVALEMSGNAIALRSAIENMAHGGRIAQLGIPTAEITLDVNAIVFNQLTLRGIYGREMYETWYQSAVLISAGLDITPVITHRFPYTEFEAAFAAARSGDSGKVIMDWQREASDRGPAGASPPSSEG